ncbi:hypothetical protein HGRIS_003720 [Hohenbuehelia grisea]|uniref:Uncharacterized protein n=1 Tax=Hohenbuehelia grisea TaxID=104357 RepID=A0ABR3JGC1_9AGAR
MYPQRNRVPPKAPDHNWTAPGTVRRKSVQRRVIDEDESNNNSPTSPVSATISIPPLARRKRASTSRSVSEPDLDVNVDIEADTHDPPPEASDHGFEDEEEPRPHRIRRKRQAAPDSDADVDGDGDDDSRFMASHSPPRASESTSRPSKRRTSEAPPRKKRAVVRSDSEGDDYEANDVAVDDYNEPDDEDDFIVEDTRSSKSKSNTKGGKSAATSSRRKGKVKEAPQEIMMKDERKVPPRRISAAAQDKPPVGIKRSRLKEIKSDDVDVGQGSIGSSEDPPLSATEESSLPKESAPPPLKKPKLPTIRKTKLAGSGGPSTPVSASKPSQGAKPVVDEKLATTSSVPRKPAAFAGNADFDLRNPSVYSELFKTAGGTTPRSGLNRREKEEERRKELDKMRDEARKKREDESKNTFDLQAQVDKIARFEEKLRSIRSGAMWPNSLAAKWRDVYEKGRIRHGEEAA